MANDVDDKAEVRGRRLALASAIWGARGLDDLSGSRTVQSELRGLADELRLDGHERVGATLDQAAEALSCLRAIAGAEEPAHIGRRILVMDDSEVTRDLVALALEGVGCVVAVSDTIAAMLERMGDFSPEALILDPAHPDLIDSPGKARLRERMERDVLPVILFSGEDRQSLAPQKAEFRADAIISKDQGLSEMLAQVDEVLSAIIW